MQVRDRHFSNRLSCSHFQEACSATHAALTDATQRIPGLYRELSCARRKWILVSPAAAFADCLLVTMLKLLFSKHSRDALVNRALADAVLAVDAVNPIVAASIAGRFGVVSRCAIVRFLFQN